MHHRSRLNDMSEVEFDALIEASIAHPATGACELPLAVFIVLRKKRTPANTEAPVTRATPAHGSQLQTPMRHV